MEMNDKVLVRLGHGYYKGGITPLPNVCPTIDAHIDCWHILIGEKNGRHKMQSSWESQRQTLQRNDKSSIFPERTRSDNQNNEWRWRRAENHYVCGGGVLKI